MTGCDNCHVVAVIGPCSNDIRDALQRLGAVPLELTVANTTFWSWNTATVRGPNPQKRRVPPNKDAWTRRNDQATRRPAPPRSRAGTTDRRLVDEIPEEPHHWTGGSLDG